MVIVLNGPLGIGKSTLAEALTERIEGCAMLNGDALLAALGVVLVRPDVAGTPRCSWLPVRVR